MFGALSLTTMLAKINRLTKDKEFDRVFKTGRSNYSKFAGVKVAANDADVVRLGILASNKVSKKATERNKIKRRVREVFRRNLGKLSPADYVVIVLPEALDKKFCDLEAQIVGSLKKLKVIR